jgi:hypothetical protein
VIGHLCLVRAISIEEIGDPIMNHDPSVVTDGIEVAPATRSSPLAGARTRCPPPTAPPAGRTATGACAET